MTCPNCGNIYTDIAEECYSKHCVTLRNARNYKLRQPINKLQILRSGYKRVLPDTATAEELDAVAAEVIICDCCGYEYTGDDCCGIIGSRLISLKDWWSQNGY